MPKTGTHGEFTFMWKFMASEARELLWLTWMVGGLSLLSVSLGVGAAFVLIAGPL